MSDYDPQTLIGKTAVDNSGEKIGKIGQVYLDDRTGEPAWITVSTALLGSQESFAPLDGVQVGDDVRLSVTKEQVKDAPTVGDDTGLSDSDQEQLYRYYSRFGIGTGAYTDDIADKATAGTTTGAMPETGYVDPATAGTRPYRASGDASGSGGAPGSSGPV